MSREPAAPFYRGGQDDQIGQAANGAHANRNYLSVMSQGAWAQVVTHRVAPRIHCITGYSVANCTYVEGKSGLIMIDTGHNIGCGQELLAMKAQFSPRPVSALIYSHHHYTGGAAAVIAAYGSMPIVAHPGVARNTPAFYSPRTLSRGLRQVGFGLPAQGADAAAVFGFRVPQFEQPGLNASGYVPANRTVHDGEELTIDGVDAVVHHAFADADDSLITHFPELDLVHHNAALMPVMFPLYTLRGDAYRDPEKLIAGLDRIRSIAPSVLIGCHGLPLCGRDAIHSLVTLHRDAYAYLYQQTLRGIERGLGPDDLAREIKLPAALADDAGLFPAYVDSEHIVRGIYRGLIGWWANSGAELHPPAPAEYGATLIAGFGGASKMLATAQTAFDERKYNLTAKLLSDLLAAEPDHVAARQLQSRVLRQMAYTTPTGIQTRNFLLAEARSLASAVGAATPSGMGGMPRLMLGQEALMRLPLYDLLAVFCTAFDPAIVPDFCGGISLHFQDDDHRFTVYVRHGAVEVLHEGDPQQICGASALTLTLDRGVMVDLVTKSKTLSAALTDGSVVAEVRDDPVADALIRGFAALWGE